jgi:subtilisin family serine protease
VIVAAVGNSDQAPLSPWLYASYPAALPHVVGVSSFARGGAVSDFSDRDPVFNDIAAPGEDIFSTLPRALTRDNPTCADQGYSDCGPPDYRHAEGTSFAAPQVTAAAALLIAQTPSLKANQVTAILERSTDDLNASTGCALCPPQRDALSGWGRLDVAAALSTVENGVLPTPDRFETNDDVGAPADLLPGARGRLAATVDYWDDRSDVYPIELRGQGRVSVSVLGAVAPSARIRLWSPETRSIYLAGEKRIAVATSERVDDRQRLTFTVPTGEGGRYYAQVVLARPSSGPYTLRWSKR